MKLANTKIVKAISKNGGQLVSYLSKNSPTILTGCAVAGAVAAVVLAVKATKPALEHIDEAKIEHRDRIIIPDGDEREDMELTQEEIDSIQLKPLEVIQACWKDYIPTGIALAGTTACIIGAHTVSAKRMAAMAALYQMSETALKDYKEQAEKIVGKKKAEEIKDAVAEQQLARVPYSEGQFIETGHGQTKCFDPMTGRYFKSDIQFIRSVQNTLNERMINGFERISQNDYYYEMGLDGVQHGDESGWSTDTLLEMDFTSSLMSDGTPVLVVGLKNGPVPWYRDC